MKIIFGNGGAKYRKHDAFNSCGSLTLKSETDEERFALAAILRAVSNTSRKDERIQALQQAIESAAECCEESHNSPVRQEHLITSGKMETESKARS